MSAPAATSEKGSGGEGAVSDWLSGRVDLCMYVEKLDFDREQDPGFVCESYRKMKWVRDKQRRQLEALQKQQEKQDEPRENAGGSDPVPEPPLVAPVNCEEKEPEDVPDSHIEDSREPLEILMGDVLRGYNLSVTCRGLHPAHGSDPLKVISIPCIRDGNSLTLCSPPGIGDQLVVFGGRVLRDTSILLPRGVRQDPMQFERVRYTYSNSVYSFDIASSTWTRRECSGREPRERSDHTALFMAPRHLLIFGGRGRNGQVFRDFFALSLELWHWTQLDTTMTPYERYWHGWCIAFDTEQPWQQEPSIFLFGGKSDTLVYSDLHQLKTTHLKHLLEDEEEHVRKYCRGDGGETTAQRQIERKVDDATRVLMKEIERQQLPAWFAPGTAGKPPSARFGMQVVALENEQLAVVGGWRIPKAKKDKKSRSLDVHILDLTTLVWSTPRLSTLVTAQPYVPSERLLFECFCVNQTLVIFGGGTYNSNGETESFTACEDASTALYKLDVRRMIWRRQKFPAEVEGDDAAVPLPVAHSHCSNNAVLNGRAFTCSCATFSMFVGKEALTLSRQKLANSFLFVNEMASDTPRFQDSDDVVPGQESVLECHARLKEKFTIRPMTTASKSHKSLTMSMRAKHNKSVQKLKEYISELDGEREQEQRVKITDEKLRLQNRKKARQGYEYDRERSSRMDAQFLEDGYDAMDYDDDEHVGAIKEQFGKRKSAPAHRKHGVRRSVPGGGFDEYRSSQQQRQREAERSDSDNDAGLDEGEDEEEEEEMVIRSHKKRRTVDEEDSE